MHCFSGKALSITYSECVSIALIVPYAMRWCRVVVYASPPVQYFPTLSHQRLDFRKKVTGHKMCVLIFSTTFVRSISH